MDHATIFSLRFNPSGSLLACTSDKATLHIFEIAGRQPSAGSSAMPSSPSSDSFAPHSPGRLNAGAERTSANAMAWAAQRKQPDGEATSTRGYASSEAGGGAPSIVGGSSAVSRHASSRAGPPPSPTSATDASRGRWGILGRIPLMPRVFSDVYSSCSCPFETGDEAPPTLVAGASAGLGVAEVATLGTSRPPKGVLGWLDDATVLVVGGGRDARWEKFVVTRDDQAGWGVKRDSWKRYLAGNG